MFQHGVETTNHKERIMAKAEIIFRNLFSLFAQEEEEFLVEMVPKVLDNVIRNFDCKSILICLIELSEHFHGTHDHKKLWKVIAETLYHGLPYEYVEEKYFIPVRLASAITNEANWFQEPEKLEEASKETAETFTGLYYRALTYCPY